MTEPNQDRDSTRDSAPPMAEAAPPQPHPENHPRPEKPERQPIRRVGTLTMGLALIVTGIVALLAMFFPNFDLTIAMRLSPLIFISLGIEILIANFRFKDARLKYDFLSGFVCFILILAGGCLAAAPIAWNYFGPPAIEIRAQLNNRVEEQLRESLAGSRIDSMYVNVELPYYKKYAPDSSVQELSKELSANLHFNLSGPYSDERAFAEDCREILSKVDAQNLKVQQVSLNYHDNRATYRLELWDKFQLNFSTEELLRQIDVSRYEEDPDEESEFAESSPS